MPGMMHDGRDNIMKIVPHPGNPDSEIKKHTLYSRVNILINQTLIDASPLFSREGIEE